MAKKRRKINLFDILTLYIYIYIFFFFDLLSKSSRLDLLSSNKFERHNISCRRGARVLLSFVQN